MIFTYKKLCPFILQHTYHIKQYTLLDIYFYNQIINSYVCRSMIIRSKYWVQCLTWCLLWSAQKLKGTIRPEIKCTVHDVPVCSWLAMACLASDVCLGFISASSLPIFFPASKWAQNKRRGRGGQTSIMLQCKQNKENIRHVVLCINALWCKIL